MLLSETIWLTIHIAVYSEGGVSNKSEYLKLLENELSIRVRLGELLQFYKVWLHFLCKSRYYIGKPFYRLA